MNDVTKLRRLHSLATTDGWSTGHRALADDRATTREQGDPALAAAGLGSGTSDVTRARHFAEEGFLWRHF